MHQQSSTLLCCYVGSVETLSTIDLKCDAFSKYSVEFPYFFFHSFMSLLNTFLRLFPCQLFFFFFFPSFWQALFFFPGFWQALISIKNLTKHFHIFISSFSSILCIALACLVSCSSLFSLLHGHAF